VPAAVFLRRSNVEPAPELVDGRRRVEVRPGEEQRRRKAEAIRCYAGELGKLEA
jgi:hypothetical protein